MERPSVKATAAGPSQGSMSPSWFASFYARGWQPPLGLSVVFAVVCVVACVAFYMIEVSASRRFKLVQPAPPDRFAWSDLWRFDRSFWYIVGLCVTFYSVILPFRSTFAIKYFQHAHGLALDEAGAMNGYVYLAAIFATPLFGLMVDKVGHRAFFMTFGTALLAIVFPILGYTTMRESRARARTCYLFSRSGSYHIWTWPKRFRRWRHG